MQDNKEKNSTNTHSSSHQDTDLLFTRGGQQQDDEKKTLSKDEQVAFLLHSSQFW